MQPGFVHGQAPLISGSVSRIGALMGRKKVGAADPAEKSDRDVLEALIDLAERESRELCCGASVHGGVTAAS